MPAGFLPWIWNTPFMSEPKQRKCLFIAYDFPPCKAVGGALRSFYFCKYLPEFGWDPFVISLAEPGIKYVEYTDTIRLPSATPFSKPYELTPYGWAWALHKFAINNNLDHSYDIIYVSCPPFPQSYVALLLKAKLRCPLVVDFRDAWSMDPYLEGSRIKRLLYKRLFPGYERKILNGADTFIANTPSMLAEYQKTYPFLQGKSLLIPNGFDDQDYTSCEPSVSSDIFTLLYCGRFGIGGRNPTLLLKAVKKFVSQHGNRLMLRIIGDNSLLLQNLVNEMGLGNCVTLSDAVPHSEAIRQMYCADVLILYQENSSAVISAIAGKTYEYLRIGKPILAIAPLGDNLTLISKIAKRHEIVTNYKEETVIDAITVFYNEWRNNTLPVSISADQEYLNQYNRRHLTGRLSQTFNSIIHRKS
jgi:glycosyltransferase involved in cell wall biosynthesis